MAEVWESIPKWGCNSTPTADQLKSAAGTEQLS